MSKPAVPSDRLYDSMLEKWKSFLHDNFYFITNPITEDDADDQYVALEEDFGKEHGYSKETLEMAFHERWYDTFADEFYSILENQGIKIVHEDEGAVE